MHGPGLLRSFLVTVFLAANVLGQTGRPSTPHSVVGSVRDPSDAAIVGARVSLLDRAGEVIALTTTDRSGNFRFDRLAGGDYQVQAEQVGFKSTRAPVTV